MPSKSNRMVNRSYRGAAGWNMVNEFLARDAMSEGLVIGEAGRARCSRRGGLAAYAIYRGAEWGRPVRDDIRLFEKICLEGFQSGLSWLTILRKRENFRKAFAGYRRGPACPTPRRDRWR